MKNKESTRATAHPHCLYLRNGFKFPSHVRLKPLKVGTYLEIKK